MAVQSNVKFNLSMILICNEHKLTSSYKIKLPAVNDVLNIYIYIYVCVCVFIAPSANKQTPATDFQLSLQFLLLNVKKEFSWYGF